MTPTELTTAPPAPTELAASADDPDLRWLALSPLTAWVPWTGRAVLLPDGSQVAVFRLGHERVAAIDNLDPYTGANVLARGIVGNEGPITKVASPLLKHRFDLATGTSLDDPARSVAVHPVRVRDGVVELGLRPQTPAAPVTTLEHHP